ncbi:hypothetical protein EDD18DRAFT_1206271, partial [Armillaria luteobubalina]
MLLSLPDTKARVLLSDNHHITSTQRVRTMLLSRIIWKGHQCAKVLILHHHTSVYTDQLLRIQTESHTKRMEHPSPNPMVLTSQNLSSGLAIPPGLSRKDRRSCVERYQLESHLLTAQIEILQSHIIAYIADQPPGDLRYTPNPLGVIAARHHNERQEAKSSRALVKEVRKLRMKREELLASREQMKAEYEERQRSRRIGRLPFDSYRIDIVP